MKGFFIAAMKALSLNQLKCIERDILVYFKAFCEENNLHFFLSNGTLLGAVKYHGFIPWDDDVDVLVPRADYDRLLALFKDSQRYRLFSPERNHGYRFPFAKLCDMTTLKIEDNLDDGVELGVNIDIFPLDQWANEKSMAVKQSQKIQKYIRMLTFMKYKKADSRQKLKRIIKSIAIRILHPFYSVPIRKIAQIADSNNHRNLSRYKGCVVWCVYGEREILPNSIFNGSVLVEFEGELYPAPIGYVDYLSSLYGEYQLDPPLEAQVTHHRFNAYIR